MPEIEYRARATIENVTPQIDCGHFPIKRAVGEKVVVEADVFADGLDALSAVLLYRKETDTAWSEAPMHHVGGDRWQGAFTVTDPGRYRYTILAWVDRFRSWHNNMAKKAGASEDFSMDILSGAEIISQASERAKGRHANTLRAWAQTLRSEEESISLKTELVLSNEVAQLMDAYPDRRFATTYRNELPAKVEVERARFSTWYAMFPRSASPTPGRHGTFKDCEERLPYISSMGFDTLYLTPIHPIGSANRKGKNNALKARPSEPGSPWAIGSKEGGHKAVHPRLGTLEDFRHLVSRAREMGIEVALEIALSCSPDHPYINEHPEWFHMRPDGTVQHAENPPHCYEDITFFNFETEQADALWEELKSVIFFWIEQGVRVFRVDNPHTKPFRFWEWLIAEVKKSHPDVLFLAEAFTRPIVMYHLSKLGFCQSYTYFAWRNAKWELTQYLNELTHTPVRDFFIPVLWTNTPDVLTGYLQTGGRAAFIARLVLAATLGASYGIYGPPFELMESAPMTPGSEDYLNSEKYEIRFWDIDRPDSLKDLIALVNRIRRENPALQHDWSLAFHNLDNDRMICYSKRTEDLSDVILVVVNLDPSHKQSGWVELPLAELGLKDGQPYQVHDLLTDARYTWQGSRNYVELSPAAIPAHIFRIERERKSEGDSASH